MQTELGRGMSHAEAFRHRTVLSYRALIDLTIAATRNTRAGMGSHLRVKMTTGLPGAERSGQEGEGMGQVEGFGNGQSTLLSALFSGWPNTR
jgi:hypothetical protein